VKLLLCQYLYHIRLWIHFVKYSTVKIPQELLERVDEYIKRTDLGYRNRSEFVVEVVRRELLRLEQREINQKAAIEHVKNILDDKQ